MLPKGLLRRLPHFVAFFAFTSDAIPTECPALPMSLKIPLRFGLPKGSLEQSTTELLGRAGFKVQSSSRGY
jgi:hypothetical protein